MARRNIRTRTVWEVTDSTGAAVARCSTWREAIAECERRNRELGRREHSVEARTVRLELAR
jgi:hypothetical protein